MSFVFRGSRSDIESGFPGFIHERPSVRFHSHRPVNSNSLAFLVTVLLLFMVLNSHQLSSNFLLWLVVAVFLMATSLRMYATCQQLQAQARAHAAAASGLLGHTELRVHMPPSIAFATRGRLQGLRLQLALLDRELDDLDYDALRALDIENASAVPSMTEEEINALPVHKYKATGPQRQMSAYFMISCHTSMVLVFGSGLLLFCTSLSSQWEYILSFIDGLFSILKDHTQKWSLCFLDRDSSSRQHISSSSGSSEVMQGSDAAAANTNYSEDDLMCTICLEQVNKGDLVRSLPCLHQFHANCIDPWLRQQGTCPMCKHKMGSYNESRESESDGSDMV
ncbi:hypothetical protein SAY87_016315 [Trapa incisa]|uniref:RING-type E3 ubiquitin transferase n=1 Tax=Trapa incisa TaxID=236973 RepID=A0AAN7L9T8_9MYRT|nr:hypothetical protein SAY87_016315 [Trapa incisa]